MERQITTTPGDVLAALEYARRYTGNARLQVQTLELLMFLWDYPGGIPTPEVERITGWEQGFISRTVRAYGPNPRRKRLLDQVVDPDDAKRRLISLNPKGVEMVRTYLSILAGSPVPELPAATDKRKGQSK